MDLQTSASFGSQYLQTPAVVVARNTGKNLSAANLFRACYQHLTKSFRLPITVNSPSSINVQTWIDNDAVEAEVIKHTQSFQIGPSTEEEFKNTPFGNLARILHFSLFQQLSTLVLTKQQLQDVELDLPCNLQYLDLSYNRFKHVPSAVVRMKYLRVLKMPGNALQEIKSVHSLPLQPLVEIHVQDNEHLRLLDFSGMDALQYINCKRAHPKLQLINCASVAAREVVVDDDSRHIQRLFIDQEDEKAYQQQQQHPQQLQQQQQLPGYTSGWTFLHSTDWIRELEDFRRTEGNKRLVTAVREKSARQIQEFFQCLQTALLLEAVVPAETKIALKALQTKCAFRRFFPSFDALASASLKKAKLTQFAAFLRFCEVHQCFMDWSQLEHHSSLSVLFAASKLTLDICSIFPAPNEMNRELADIHGNEALFQSVLMDNFSNHHALRRYLAQQEEKSKAEQLAKDRAKLLEDELRELSKRNAAEQKHVEDLVQFELLHGYTLQQTRA